MVEPDVVAGLDADGVAVRCEDGGDGEVAQDDVVLGSDHVADIDDAFS